MYIITMLKMHFFLNQLQIFQKTICNMVVEVPRWTNAKMEVSLFLFCFMFNLSSHIGQKSSCFSRWSVNPC